MTIDELDPQTRQQFETLRDELQEAQEAIQAAEQRAYDEDPLLRIAVDAKQKAAEAEREMNELRADANDFFEARSGRNKEEVEQWQLRFGEVLDYQISKKLFESDQWNPIIQWLFVQMAKKHPNKIEHLDDLSQQQIVEKYLSVLKQNHDENLDEYGRLQGKLKPPASAQHFMEKRILASVLHLAGASYVEQEMPEHVDRARLHAKEVARELNKVWPNWGKAEETVREKARDEARIRGVTLEQSSKNWALIAINVVIVAALVVIIMWRLWRKQPEP